MHDFELRERIDEDEAAAHYDDLYHGFPVIEYWDEDFLAFVGSEWAEGDRVLDLGCGPASLWSQWERLPEPGRLAGVDISSGMVEQARQRYPDAEIVVGRVHDLPFESGSFDVVIASSVLHHIPDEHLPAAFDEIVRVLDEHGRVVGREPKVGGIAQEPGWLSGCVMNFRHMAYRLTRSREYPEPELGEHHHVFDLDVFRRIVESHLTITRLEQRFAFSSYLTRVRLPGIATLAAKLDHRLMDRTGTMFYYSAHKNYRTADDVAYATEMALGETERTMTDEEFLVYIATAAKEIERALSS